MPNNDAVATDLARAETLWKAADALRGQIDAAEYSMSSSTFSSSSTSPIRSKHGASS